MDTKSCSPWAGMILALALMLAGCGTKEAQANARVFDKAPPEIKSTWEQGAAADKANDYFNAATAYNQLVAQESQLTPKQFETVLAASRGLMQRMIDAGNHGDEAAKQALAKIMGAQRHR